MICNAETYKDGSPFNPAEENFQLSQDTNNQLEFYYNKGNYYGLIRVKDLDNPNPSTNTTTFEYYDISKNGGFYVKDGNLSIGSARQMSLR